MKKIFKNHICLFPMLVAGLTLSACQKDHQPSGPGAAANPAAPTIPGSTKNPGPGSTPPVTGGTGDVGGGNGLNNQVLERYRVDITELDAYKKVLLPRQELNILSEREKKDKVEGKKKIDMNLKTWYIAPVKLKPISNEILGLSFSESGTDQLAIQTIDEVWIAKEFWDKMNLMEQADLITHESMMILYMFKFLETKTLCRKYFDFSESTCDTWIKMNAGIDVFEKPRPLNAQDYQNIRSATVWFISRKEPYTSEQVNNTLSKYGFDARFFKTTKNADEEFDVSLDRKLTHGEVWDLVARNIQKDQFRNQCGSTLDQHNSPFPCQVTLQSGDFSTSFDPSLFPVPDTYFQWKVEGPLSLGGKLAFKKQEANSYGLSHTDYQNGFYTEWYSSPDIYLATKKTKRIPG